MPVYDITYRYVRQILLSAAASIAAGGTIVYFTIPSGQRWRLIFIVKGATVGSVAIQLQTHDKVEVSVTAPATIETRFFASTDFWLNPGDSLGLNGGNVADINIPLVVYVEQVAESDHR